ncbi:hypothetical protein FHU38_000104 [Saccharomonospora amisosensis]|uniref:Uncharacterized protein n=2 Tax=Saccharomonospora TaxID=1851 RepID=H5X706_9PSEU|nr:hypothetical protein [Saccharomonospora amisosensis]EHR53474.1 hypothetical protein SacmaDRAFT_5329 [Saccharomonospora marina XMU15]NIJ09760.1 hypothetical protein [Saccharomonospora amisosensis]
MRLYPELQCLIDMVDSGWEFVHRISETFCLVRLDAACYWPTCVDGLKVFDRYNAVAVRWAWDGHELWRSEGSLADVVEGLLSLPAG